MKKFEQTNTKKYLWFFSINIYTFRQRKVLNFVLIPPHSSPPFSYFFAYPIFMRLKFPPTWWRYKEYPQEIFPGKSTIKNRILSALHISISRTFKGLLNAYTKIETFSNKLISIYQNFCDIISPKIFGRELPKVLGNTQLFFERKIDKILGFFIISIAYTKIFRKIESFQTSKIPVLWVFWALRAPPTWPFSACLRLELSVPADCVKW